MRVSTPWRKGYELETRAPGELLADEDQPGRERLDALKERVGRLATDEEAEQLARDLESGRHDGVNRSDLG
jgi:hypothetical protein